MSNFTTVQDNVIEFLKGDNTATVTFCQPRFITKIRKLAKKHPDECQITHENKDGSIVAHIPVKWIKISRIDRQLTDEQRAELAERVKVAQEHRRNALKSALNDLGKEI